jgi:uncharacterized protein YjhX (UPF0386 family)
MNISKAEQRALHVLAQGGAIHFKRGGNGHVYDVLCFNRDGYALRDFTLETFKRLKTKRLIRSNKGQPYVITHEGRLRVNAQLDNR